MIDKSKLLVAVLSVSLSLNLYALWRIDRIESNMPDPAGEIDTALLESHVLSLDRNFAVLSTSVEEIDEKFGPFGDVYKMGRELEDLKNEQAGLRSRMDAMCLRGETGFC